MRELGKFLFIFGVGSMVLSFLGYELRLLFWIETWGEQVGWAIRIGMAAVGAAVFLVAGKGEAEPAATA
jgi:hypothetical protein